MTPWVDWLRGHGHEITGSIGRTLMTESERPAEHSHAAFMTERATRLARPPGPADGHWFAHLSYLRPHPPYAAAGAWAERYDPADVELPIPRRDAEPPPPPRRCPGHRPGARPTRRGSAGCGRSTTG